MRPRTNRLLAFLMYLVCLIWFAILAQGQQQQSPPIWDRSGVPTAQATGGQGVSSDKVGPEVTWERYSSRSEEFSALLPGQPIRFSASRPPKLFEKRKGGSLYSAYADGTVYVVLSYENPKRKDSLAVFTDEFQEYPIFHNGAVFEREVTLNGFTGKQYRLKGSPGIDGIAQFYVAKDHAYIFEVVSDKISDPPVNRFLNSLTLDGKTKGKEITEPSQTGTSRPAAQPSAPPSASVENKSVEQSKVLNPKEVTRKAVVVTRPEPGYTEEARRHQISGTVTLRAVFSGSGDMTGIRPVSNLPYGLTEKAIGAARSMRFIPAVKDGRYVSQYVTIEYNFNIY